MRYLIDTHVLIWWMEGSNRLSENAYSLINDPTSQIFVSVASVWEIVVKKAKKKLHLSQNIERSIKSRGLSMLSIELAHVLETGRLPLYHNDPFDRILIAQARVENSILITSDPKIWKYNLKLIKA